MLGAAIRPLFGQQNTPSLNPGHKALTRSVKSENGMGQHYTDPNHPVVRRAVSLAQQIGAKDVLDLGTGRGLTALALAREAAPRRVVATDINEVGLQALKNEATRDALPVETAFFDVADKLPRAWQRSFDLVVAKDVYPFLNPKETTLFLKNAAQALRKNGYFLFSAPRLESRLGQENEQTIPTNPYYRKLSDKAKRFIQTAQNYFNFVTTRQLKRKLWQAGLEMKETAYFGRDNGWLMVLAQKAPPHTVRTHSPDKADIFALKPAN